MVVDQNKIDAQPQSTASATSRFGVSRVRKGPCRTFVQAAKVKVDCERERRAGNFLESPVLVSLFEQVRRRKPFSSSADGPELTRSSYDAVIFIGRTHTHARHGCSMRRSSVLRYLRKLQQARHSAVRSFYTAPHAQKQQQQYHSVFVAHLMLD